MRAASRFAAAGLGFRIFWSLEARRKVRSVCCVWSDVLGGLLAQFRCDFKVGRLQVRLRTLLASLLSSPGRSGESGVPSVETCHRRQQGDLEVQIVAARSLEMFQAYPEWAEMRRSSPQPGPQLHFPFETYRQAMNERLPPGAAVVHIVRADRALAFNLTRPAADLDSPPDEIVAIRAWRRSRT